MPLLITQAVRHQVLKWAQFIGLVYFGGLGGGGWLPVFMLIGWRTWHATNNHVLCSWVKYSWADDMVQVAKYKMWASEVCFAYLELGSMYCLLERSHHLQMHTLATLNFIECFWLGSVHSASKLNSKCAQMNCEMNCITMSMHKCTETYSKWP